MTTEADIFDRLFRRFAASLRPEVKQSIRPVLIATAIVFFFAILLVLSPRILVADYTYDFFIPLDGALRMLNGQWPHLDFYTPIGDLYYILLGICARLFGFSPRVVLWEQIIVMPVAIWAVAFATRDRLPNSLRAFLMLTTGFLCISPGNLDDAASISFLASYNRHCWVFMIPVLAAAFLEPMHGKRKGWIGNSLLLFAIVLSLFYLKMTFALVAGASLVVAAATVPSNRRSCITALVLCAIAIGIISVSSGLTVAYIKDIHRAALATPTVGEAYDPFRLDKLKVDLSTEWFALSMPLCFAVWLSRTAYTAAERQAGNRTLLICMIVAGGSIALAWQNHEHSMPSQIVAMSIVFAAMRNRQMRREQNIPASDRQGPSGWSPIILAGVFFIFIATVSILTSSRAIILHTAKTALNLVQPVATLSPYLQGLSVPIDTMPGVIDDVLAGKIDPALYSEKAHFSWHNDVSAIFDNGWRLIQNNKPSNARIVTLYSAPLMTVATGTTPPRHMAAWMDLERTVGARSPIKPEQDFVDANVVMIFKLYNHDILFSMVRDYLKSNFHVAGETPIWQMWVRNGAS